MRFVQATRPRGHPWADGQIEATGATSAALDEARKLVARGVEAFERSSGV